MTCILGIPYTESMRNRQSLVSTVLAVIFFSALLCVGIAIAEPIVQLPDVDADPLGALVLMVQHWQAGAVGVAIAIGLSVIVAFVRRLQVVLPWMGTDRGGAVTALVVALCTSVAAALVQGSGITLAVLTSGAVALFLAVGGRQWLRRLLYPADASGPAWLDWAWLRWMLGQPAGARPAIVSSHSGDPCRIWEICLGSSVYYWLSAPTARDAIIIADELGVFSDMPEDDDIDACLVSDQVAQTTKVDDDDGRQRTLWEVFQDDSGPGLLASSEF